MFGWSKLLLLVVVLTCSACFDLVEEMDLNPNGSGTWSITLNLSQSKSRLSSIMLLDSIQGYKVPSKNDIVRQLDKWVSESKNYEGISNARYSTDFEEFIVVFSVDFNSLESLNNAINSLRSKSKIQNKSIISVYTFDAATKKFEKNFQYDPEIRKSFESLKKEDQEVFSNAQFISINRFGSEVKFSSNKKSVISRSGKAVMLRTGTMDLINGDFNLSNTIQLK